MTDENIDADEHENTPSSQTQENSVFDRDPETDWYLGWIVGLGEKGLETGITLTVGGNLVTGTLISGRKYFEEMGALIQKANGLSPDLSKALANTFSQWKDLYPESGDDDDTKEHYNFIHLRRARFMADGQNFLPQKQGLLWRAKLSRVDGFSMGVLEGWGG